MKPNSIITKISIPNLINNPGISFNKNDFEEAIWNRGYEVILESAIPCPCRSKENGAPLASCQNCGGSGWVLFNPVQTRVVLQSLNLNTKYKEWSRENIGTTSVTCKSENKLDYMSRITVVDSDSMYSQVLYPYTYNNVLFAFTIYDIVNIEEIFMFQGENQPLLKLAPSNYSYDGNKIIFNDQYLSVENFTVSVRYHHRLQYHVLDLVHNVRNNYTANTETKGYDQLQVLPINAVARLSHYVLDALNAEKNNMITNDYVR